MCEVSRREFLAGGTAFLSLAAEAELLAGPIPPGMAEAGKADLIAPDVYFHEGRLSDTADAVCNNGWIVFEDYVLVIDANFPAGAKLIISKIRSLTDKPIRFALDTHHHGDHAYGNQVFVDNGAVPVAHTGVIEEMKRYETGYYGNQQGAWEAWLPKERVLFAGDICVNGPYNYVGDGDVGKWVATLDAARKLGAKIVGTGHGPRSDAQVLDDQQAFFKAMRDEVGALMAERAPEEAKAQVESVRAALKGNAQIARFVGERGTGWDPFPAQVEKVYQELTGKKLAALMHEPHLARQAHQRSHGLASA